MPQDPLITGRRTSADDVFDHLHDEIVSLRLLPGTRISEVDVARQFGVSRQPVREAFIRLGNEDLLLIRPQKATVVRKFSHEAIKLARFVRLAVEVEVVRQACRAPKTALTPSLDQNLQAQREAMAQGQAELFHNLDLEYHSLICAVAGREYVLRTVAEQRARIDRLCLLSLSEPAAMTDILADHIAIAEAIGARDETAAEAALRLHLSRLDETVAAISRTHANFFED